MQLGLIKKDGKIQAYKMPEHDVHKAQMAEREIKEKLTKERLRVADHSLELRMIWLLKEGGYGSSSSDIQDGDRLPASSKIPSGCEIPELAAKSIATLDAMLKLNDTSRKYANILNYVYLYRKENESLNNLFNRLSFEFSYKQYLAARKMYANILYSW